MLLDGSSGGENISERMAEVSTIAEKLWSKVRKWTTLLGHTVYKVTERCKITKLPIL